jgi:hypothetical protein
MQMTMHGAHAFAHAGARSVARDRDFERQLTRLHPKVRPAVHFLAERHVHLAELSESFPALLVALAWPRKAFNRHAVIAGVIAGSPLGSLAAQAGVPLWLRRMRPQMLPGPLPPLPDSPFLRHRIVNHFPTHPKHAPEWFRAVSFAGEWVNEEFALWCAQVFAKRIQRRRADTLRLVGLWAWHSAHRDTFASALIATPFNPAMEYRAAMTAAFKWRERIELDLLVGGRPVQDMWLSPATVDGFEFVPLKDAGTIDAEAEAMQHCLRTYAERIAENTSRFWSVRRDGTRVATLQLERYGNDRVAGLGQMRLVRNGDPSHQVWTAAHRWLRGQEVRVLDAEDCIWRPAVPERRRWQGMWKPFWIDRGRIPDWLPLVPAQHTLYDI